MRSILIIFMASLSLSHCSDESPAPKSTNPIAMEFGLEQRPDNSSCMAPERPGTPMGSLALLDAFPAGSNMSNLLDMRRGPTAFPSWWGIRQNGDVLVMRDGQVTAQVAMTGANLSGLSSITGEEGLLGLEIDPFYPKTGFENIVRIFLYYTSNQCGPNIGLCSRVSRFTFRYDDIDGRFVLVEKLDGSNQQEDELMIVRQPFGNHNGGALRIGTNNFLYITMGDGGSGNDPYCAGLNLHTPLGKLLRLNIDTLASYAIPSTNPYADVTQRCDRFNTQGSASTPDVGYASNCPEIVAFGLRNPFRISVDPNTGYIWLGDVGQDAVEEIDRFDPNNLSRNNFGWPLREGTRASTNGACSKLNNLDVNFVEPVYYYRHTDNSARSVVGGVVYRGLELGEQYRGKYIFSEAYTGDIWLGSQPNTDNRLDLTDVAPLGFKAFSRGYTQDENNELYLLAAGSTPKKFQLSGNTVSNFPQTLAQTGCFSLQDPSKPVEAMIPYSVNSPLWSDGAVKERHFAIPNGTTISVDANGDMTFPIGSVLTKTFRTPSNELLETRLLVRHQDGGWAGYAYAWNVAGTQATLVEGETLIPQHAWTIPSRNQCDQCHTGAAGNTLGPEIAQLNGDFIYSRTNFVANQLATLSHIGILETAINDPIQEARLVSTQSEDMLWAVRSYLHSNCAHCHQPSGGTNSPMDLRHWIPLSETGLCNAPSEPAKWPIDSLIVKPTNTLAGLNQSLLWTRSGAQLDIAMPPLGRSLEDQNWSNLLREWIFNLSACP